MNECIRHMSLNIATNGVKLHIGIIAEILQIRAVRLITNSVIDFRGLPNQSAQNEINCFKQG